MNRLRKIWFAVTKLLGRKRADSELDEELRFHLDYEVRNHVKAGMSPDEARRQAHRDFGNDLKLKDECRDAWGTGAIDTLTQDIRFGVRMLAKRPGFTAIIIGTLAIGIGANTAIFSLIHAALLQPLPFKDAERIVMLWEQNPELGFDRAQVAPSNLVQWTNQSRTLADIGFVNNETPKVRNFYLRTQDGQERMRGCFASSGLFRVLGVSPLIGRAFTLEEDVRGSPPVAVLSHALWQRNFAGDPDVVGQTVNIRGIREIRYQVVGVMPPQFRMPTDAEFWLSVNAHLFYNPDRISHNLSVVARLKSGVTVEQAEAELSGIQSHIAREHPDVPQIASAVAVVPMLDQVIGSRTRSTLLVLFGAVGFVLLIACANVANLVLARAPARRKEIAVRTALGAGRLRIVRQLLTESLILAIFGSGLGVLLAWWGVQIVPTLGLGADTGFQMDRFQNVGINLPVLGFSLLLATATGVISGIAPALESVRPDLNESLKDAGRGSTESRGRLRFRSALLAAEVALAVALLIGAGLMVQSFERIQKVETGFNPHNLLTAYVDLDLAAQRYTGARQDYTLQIMQRAAALPGVKSAAAVSSLPFGVNYGGAPVVIEGRSFKSESDLQLAEGRNCTPGFFETMGIPLLKGRDFTERDTFDSPIVCIVNHSFARRFFPGEDPVGQRIILWNTGFPLDRQAYREIVGVVGDSRDFGLNAEIGPLVYRPYRQERSRFWGGVELVLPMVFRTEGDPLAVIPTLRRELEGDPLHGKLLLQPKSAEEILASSAANQRFSSHLMGLFALVALALGTVGIYGVMSYSVAQRTRELGLRMALGAHRGSVLRLVLGQGLRLCLWGLVLGLAIAFVGARVLNSFLYGIEAHDPLTFAVISLLLITVALLASYLPARRATRIDPMIALRHE